MLKDGEYYGSHEFQVGGLEKLRIDSSGNVMLDVNNWLQGHVTQRSGTQSLIRSRAMGYPGYYGCQVGEENNHIALFIDPLSVAGGSFSGNVNELMLPNKVIFQQANAVTSPTNWLNGESITLDNGKVGIGEPSPTAKLQVNGQLKIGSGGGSGTDSGSITTQVNSFTFGATGELNNSSSVYTP